jgi:hypothetical protein
LVEEENEYGFGFPGDITEEGSGMSDEDIFKCVFEAEVKEGGTPTWALIAYKIS